MLPNLFVIGAAKCGTTSLHQYLTLHPQIEMSVRKEVQVFSRDEWREKLGWYDGQFAGLAPVRGESSTAYTMFPFMPSVAERIHELVPDAKLIYVVRDPVERAFAHYVEWFALGLENRSVTKALADADTPANPYICASRYASQLERYLSRFQPAQILALDSQELLERRASTLREIFRFLGVDPGFTSPDFQRTHNPRTEKLRYRRLGYWLAARGILTVRRRPRRPGRLVPPLHRWLSRPVHITFPDETRRALVELLDPEVARWRELTGKPFADWSSFPVRAGGREPRARA